MGACLYPHRRLCYNPNIENQAHSSLTPLRQTAGAAPLRHSCEPQDARFASAFSLIEQAIRDHVFPGAAAAVVRQNELVLLKSFGQFTYDRNSPQVSPESIFDIASVTKVVATTTMAMLLYQRGLLDLEMPVIAVVPEFASDDPRRKEITLHMLLAHSSGLPAYEKLFLRASNRDELLAAAFQVPLTADPGTRAEYSDIGFIILGIALERLADEPLDSFCQREIFGPLGMARTTFNPPQPWRESCVPTADDKNFRHRVIQGEVQDENASVLGGVAAHAGLFSTAEDLAVFAHALLGGPSLARPETLNLFARRESSPAGTSRALGWDTPSSPSQSGKYFSERSIGHLGYTGTSLWLDLDRGISIVLLTNRTWPDCGNKAIKKLRPRFHDLLMEAMQQS